MGQRGKTGTLQSSTKTVTKMGTKPGAKITKTASSKAAASKDPDTSGKPPPAKKKKKVASQSFQSSTAAARLVYLTGIPADATEQEVTDLVASFGKINNVILMPGSEEEGEGDKGEEQKASVCMVRAEDAQALAHCSNLCIRDQTITASLPKKTEPEKSSDSKGNAVPAKGNRAGEEPGNEADQKTSDEKGVVLITGLPESGWSESDITKLVQPFGTPSDMIVAPEIGKVLVSLPDMETAQEMVKVHTFIPAKIQDSELKIIHLKQTISLSTPVALYNILKGSMDPLEAPAPVSWSSLVVVSNVPDTPTGPTEVQKLVRRFGSVQKTLVLNSNMVICEMATAASALSVYKRFQKFPCIIQNNPLSFSRRADPKPNTHSKVIAAYLESSKDSPSNGKDSQAAAADKEDPEHQEMAEPVPEESKQANDEKDAIDEKIDGKDEIVREERSKDGDGEVKKDQAADEVSDPAAALDPKPEADVQTSTAKSATEKLENDKSPSGQEETKASGSHGGEAGSAEAASAELPKVTQEMVDALLVECRTRTADCPNQTAESAGREQREVKPETTGKSEEGAQEKQESVKNDKEEEEEEEKRKRLERERREKEAKKEKEKRAREREERARREKERREKERREEERREWERKEEERREWERRERERKERRRTHREGSSGSRSSGRSEANRRSSGKDGQDKIMVAEKAKKVVEEEEEEEEEEFPFNMGDFVTVDEVGDVTDLPSSPPPGSPSVSMETTEDGAEGASTSAQQDTPEAQAVPDKSDPPGSDPEPEPEPKPEPKPEPEREPEPEPEPEPTTALENPAPSPVLTSSLSPSPAAQALSLSSQTAPQPEPETAPETAILDPVPEEESLPTPAPTTTASPPGADLVPNVEAASTESLVTEEEEVKDEEEKQKSPVNHSQAEEKENEKEEVAEKPAEEKKVQDEEDKEEKTPAVGAAKRERPEDGINNEECLKKKLRTQTSPCEDYTLPPFDPNNPVGMEFLVPKTGFFCKVCNRFFSGTQEAEINHCKGLKHYENLQKYLQTRKTANVTVKPVSS